MLGWGLVLGVVAIAGLPPLGIFMSEFLIVSSTFAREPVLADPGGVRPAGCLRRADFAIERSRLREPAGELAPVKASYVPLFAHLALVLVAGIYLPGRWWPGSRMWRGCWGERQSGPP